MREQDIDDFVLNLYLKNQDFAAWARQQEKLDRHRCKLCGHEGSAHTESWLDWDVCYQHRENNS